MSNSQTFHAPSAAKPEVVPARAGLSSADRFQKPMQNGAFASPLSALPRMDHADPRWPPRRTEKFFRGLPAKAISEFTSLAAPCSCPGNTALFTEDQQPHVVVFLFEGRVKLSMNSTDGRRLILGIVGPGEILGLASAVSNSPYDVTAETQLPCLVASVQREHFLGFLVSYPAACQNVARQLSLELNRSCDQLRTLGLAWTATAKLARLLLEWCQESRHTRHGLRFLCPLTHLEIAEHIGVSRETVTRTLHEFRSRNLVEQRGAALFIANLHGLEICAGAVACRQMPDVPRIQGP